HSRRALFGTLPEPPDDDEPVALDRRRFLRTAALAGGAGVAGAIASRYVGGSTTRAVASRAAFQVPKASDIPQRGTDLDITDLSSFYTSNATFYRVDTAIIVPKVMSRDWRLKIHGMVDHPMELDIDEL